jgi:hypothetical protein
MRPMGRPRSRRKDLPTGLYFHAKLGYYYRESSGVRARIWFHTQDREQAIKLYVKARHKPAPAVAGTVAELVDRYIRDELPRRIRLGKLKQITADEYARQAPLLKEVFGDKQYALTPAEPGRHDVLRRADVVTHLRQFEGLRGAVSANRLVALLSVVFENAASIGICTYNPCIGAERNQETPRKKVLTEALRGDILGNAHPALRLIGQMGELTAMRKTDIRNLMLTQISDGVIHVEQSKTGARQDFELTPAIQAVLAEAAKLPGRKISMFVFPTRKGTPYSESGMQSAWRRAKKKAGMDGVDAVFRDLRTTELNEVKKAGGDATATAGHADQRTTARHYLTVPTRVKPRR